MAGGFFFGAWAMTGLSRVLIMGNGGAGKTHLASRLGSILSRPVTHLDDLHWMPGQYGQARDRAERDALARAACAADEWVIEGVYGQLIDLAAPRATMLIWLDLPEDECIANIRQRGQQGGGAAEAMDELLNWVAAYRARRNNWNCFETHERLFVAFPRPKRRLCGRGEIDEFLHSARTGDNA